MASAQVATQVKLVSVDEQEYLVSRDVAELSETVKHMIDDVGGSEGVPLPNITGKILGLVVTYCNHYVENKDKSEEEAKKLGEKTEEPTVMSEWLKQFLAIDQATMFELILAANYLDIKPLLNTTCKAVADMIKGKTPEEIRKTFNIKNDYTPEEEEQVRKENEWCEER